MYHLDNTSGVPEMPEPKDTQTISPRWFGESEEQGGISWPGADWFNIVQAELLAILYKAGLSPDKSKYDQLAHAIQSFADGSSDELLTLLGQKGDALLGTRLLMDGAILRTQREKNLEILSVLDFDADPTGVKDSSYAFQRAILAAHEMGGGRVFIPTPSLRYRMTYPVFVLDDVEVFGTGQSCFIDFENPLFLQGRGAFVMGSSYEINRDVVLANYASGNYPNTPTMNPDYVNPQKMQYLRDNPGFIETSNASLHDVNIKAIYTGSTKNGGYGINFVNASHCVAYNIWGSGWTQLIGMGSDTTPETPSNDHCYAWNLHVLEPNQDKTYYSLFFMANSTNCKVTDGYQWSQIPDGTPNGSAGATNMVEDCEIRNIYVPNLGRTASSEGILLNNAKGCTVDNVYIGNATSAVSTFYDVSTFNDADKPNIISNIRANKCTSMVSLRAKYARLKGLAASNCSYELNLANSNASGNVIFDKLTAVNFGAGYLPLNYIQNNSLAGWVKATKVLRPIHCLVNPLTDVVNWGVNKHLETTTAALTLLYPIPDYMKAIARVRCFFSFASRSETAPKSRITISLRRIAGYNGNIHENPVTEISNYKESSLLTREDGELVTQAFSTTTKGFVPSEGSSNGADNSLDLLIQWTNNVAGNYQKEIEITYWRISQ
ncbi:hypothetical protein AGF18_21665 [Klebsiella oxytoca]|uniref:hypothetical protein n=1 Tax=Klebsiella oxytoca TaxID=571 RepID=UPI00069CA7C2|nr:hypothetical protein [Klebsiella oxytoca]APB46410.1 hypothetical protein AGF18_21665 [Klebsiella oxytoca]